MNNQHDREAFFAQWRERVRATLPEFKSQIAKIGIFGTVAVSIATLGQDPTLGGIRTYWIGRQFHHRLGHPLAQRKR